MEWLHLPSRHRDIHINTIQHLTIIIHNGRQHPHHRNAGNST
jgi:hypothetical protein